MDFFKSVFSDEPEPSSDHNPSAEPQQNQSPDTQQPPPEHSDSKDPNFTPKSPPNTSWSFGGLIKTFASKSESVLQTYKKDFEEFSSELKKETQVIRQVASKAVKDLPASLEVGASVAQESLESVGQVIDDLGKIIITQGKDVLNVDQESDSSNSDSLNYSSVSARGYSRFDSQICAIQIDLSTFLEEPEDLEEFGEWKSGFLLGEKDEEIDNLLSENEGMDGVYRKIVPKTIDDDTFWSRYFYKVYKLKQVEEARAKLVKRAIEREDEDLSWDIEDDEEEERNVVVEKGESSGKKEGSESSDVDDKIEEKEVVNEEVLVEEKSDNSELNDKSVIEKSEEKLAFDGKSDQVESCKDSDVLVVSTQPSLPEEQDLSWDEIEDLTGIDEKKVSTSDSPNKADLQKRLSVPDEEEDLSWDIEEDDD